MSKKFFFTIIFTLLPFFPKAQEPVIEIEPLPSYQARFETSLQRLREAYLKLPQDQVSLDDIRRFRKDLEELKSIVGSVKLGNFSVTEVTRPLNLLENELDRLPRKTTYTNREVANLRRWSEYLLKEPLLHTFLAKDNILSGQAALNDKNYLDAQMYFRQALDELGFVRLSHPDSKLNKPLSRIESEITVLYNAARREQFLNNRKSNNVLAEIQDAFRTYHETVFNIWSDINPALRIPSQENLEHRY